MQRRLQLTFGIVLTLSMLGVVSATAAAAPPATDARQVKLGLSDVRLGSPSAVAPSPVTDARQVKPGLSDFGPMLDTAPSASPTPSTPAAETGSFGWVDAGVGAGAMLGLVLVIGGLGAAVVVRGRLYTHESYFERARRSPTRGGRGEGEAAPMTEGEARSSTGDVASKHGGYARFGGARRFLASSYVVPAPPGARGEGAMSVSPSLPTHPVTIQMRAVAAALVAGITAVLLAFALHTNREGARTSVHPTPSATISRLARLQRTAHVLDALGLSPHDKQYVMGITWLTKAQQAAAYGR